MRTDPNDARDASFGQRGLGSPWMDGDDENGPKTRHLGPYVRFFWFYLFQLMFYIVFRCYLCFETTERVGMGGGDLNGPLVRSFLFYSYFFDTYSCYIVNIAYNLTNTSEKRDRNSWDESGPLGTLFFRVFCTN